MKTHRYELLDGSSPQEDLVPGKVFRCRVNTGCLETDFEMNVLAASPMSNCVNFSAKILPPDHGHAALEIIGDVSRIAGLYYPNLEGKVQISFWNT